MTVHLVKLCVGVESVAELARAPACGHVTRHRPRRACELLDGGSLYWVIRGTIQVRQRLLGLDPATDSAGRPACRLRLDPELVPVVPRARRPFQGWRYLEAADAPPDRESPAGADPTAAPVPAWLAAELADLGVV